MQVIIICSGLGISVAALNEDLVLLVVLLDLLNQHLEEVGSAHTRTSAYLSVQCVG